MFSAVVLKWAVFLRVVLAIPVSNEDLIRSIEENVRMASPSYVRSEDIPTSESYTGYNIFNVPIPDLNNNSPQFYQSTISNQPVNTKSGTHQTEQNFNLKGKGTQYLQDPYQNPNTILNSQLQPTGSEIYQNRRENIQTPAVRRWQEYQGTSTLQKLLSNLNLVRNILAPKPQKRQFILVYPNGTIGYADNISTVSNKYPNHVILSSSELRKLSNVESEIQNSVHSQPQENIIDNIVSSSTLHTVNNIIHNNETFDTETNPDSQLNLTNNKTESQHNIGKTPNAEVIEPVNMSGFQNTLNDVTTSKSLDLEKTENFAHNATNTTTAIYNIMTNNKTELQNNIGKIPNAEVIEPVKKSGIQNTLNNVTALKSLDLHETENLAHNACNTTTAIYNISDSNIANNTYDLNNTIGILSEDSAYNTPLLSTNVQEYNPKNTTTNKIDELHDTNKTNQNQINMNPNIEPLFYPKLENSSSSENVVDSSNVTNEFSDGETENYSNGDIPNIMTANYTYIPVLFNNTSNDEAATIVTNMTYGHINTTEDNIANEELINDDSRENLTANECHCCDDETVIEEGEDNANNDSNIKRDETDNVSWIQLAKEQAQNMLFGDNKDSPNVFFIFYNPPEMNVERETKTTTYPNGTVVEESIEIRKIDGTTIRTSTTKTYNSTTVNNTSDNG